MGDLSVEQCPAPVAKSIRARKLCMNYQDYGNREKGIIFLNLAN